MHLATMVPFVSIELVVAVPVRGAGCIEATANYIGTSMNSCRPREGCGLHLETGSVYSTGILVAVPVRGAGCIFYFKVTLMNPEHVAVPVRGAGCIIPIRSKKEQEEACCRPREGCGLHH